eukprot:GFYU01020637.1.p1 GENE.GFYU01020637.1~~GFYU01020637.1.p1  ORF type:complete len:203 (-),score=39.65 GFYU01020637.1:94-702(-)
MWDSYSVLVTEVIVRSTPPCAFLLYNPTFEMSQSSTYSIRTTSAQALPVIFARLSTTQPPATELTNALLTTLLSLTDRNQKFRCNFAIAVGFIVHGATGANEDVNNAIFFDKLKQPLLSLVTDKVEGVRMSAARAVQVARYHSNTTLADDGELRNAAESLAKDEVPCVQELATVTDLKQLLPMIAERVIEPSHPQLQRKLSF